MANSGSAPAVALHWLGAPKEQHSLCLHKGNWNPVGDKSRLHSKSPNGVGPPGLSGQNGVPGWGRILHLSDRWSLANAFRKVEFKLLQWRLLDRGQHQLRIFG